VLILSWRLQEHHTRQHLSSAIIPPILGKLSCTTVVHKEPTTVNHSYGRIILVTVYGFTVFWWYNIIVSTSHHGLSSVLPSIPENLIVNYGGEVRELTDVR